MGQEADHQCVSQEAILGEEIIGEQQFPERLKQVVSMVVPRPQSYGEAAEVGMQQVAPSAHFIFEKLDLEAKGQRRV